MIFGWITTSAIVSCLKMSMPLVEGQLCYWLASLLVGDKCNFKVNIELELGFAQRLRIIKMLELMACLLINTTVCLGHLVNS